MSSTIPEPTGYGCFSRRRPDYSISLDPARSTPQALRPPGTDLRAKVRRLPGDAVDQRGARRVPLAQARPQA